MPTLTVGEGAGAKKVTVSDEFLTLTPEQQQHTANDIAKQVGVSPTAAAAPAEEGNWRRGTIAPIEKQFTTDETGKMTDTGEWRFAVPEMVMGILDAVKLPGEVMRNEVDPMGEAGFDRTMNLAMMGVSPVKGGMKGKAYGETITESIEKIPGKVKEGLRTPSKGEIIQAPKPVEGTPSVVEGVAVTAIDQELDKFFNTQTIKSTATVGKPKEKNFPKSTVTGTMGTIPITAKANISGSIKGKLSVTATYGDEMGIQLKLKQSERTLSSAINGTADDFSTQMERAYLLEGKEMGDNIKATVGSTKPAMSVLSPKGAMQVSEKIAELPANMNKSTFIKKFFEVWMNWGLLSGPQTHAANMLGNTIVNVWGLVEHGAAASLSKVTGAGITFKEAGWRAIGDVEGIGDALRAAGASFRTEKGLFEGVLDSDFTAIPGPIGKQLRIPGRAMTAEDAFFKTLAYRQEINGLAIRNAYSEGLRGKAIAKRAEELRSNPTPEMMASARQFAQKQTFTNGLGTYTKPILQFLNTHQAWRFVVPFFRTPVNLLKWSAVRTPLGIFSKEVRADLMGVHGPVARDLAFTRMALGSAIGGYVAYQVAKDNVTGFGPSNPNERNLWRQTHQPYSVRIGDTWYSYSRLEPLGSILGLSADMKSLSKEMTDLEVDKLGFLITKSLARNLTSKTWLQGPVNLTEAIADPERYGEDYVNKTLGTVIPAGLAQYARAQDPYIREAETLLDTIKSRVPGYRETLNIRRDVTGQPLMNEGGFWKNFLSPIYTQAAKDDPVIAEMLRLGVHPGRIAKDMSGVELTPQEWDSWGSIRGEMVTQFMNATVASPVFGELSDPMRKKLLEDNVNKATDIARSALKAKYPDLLARIAQKKIVDSQALAGPPTAPPVVPMQEGIEDRQP